MVWEITPWQMFLLGGPLMWPILICSVVALAIMIEKAVFFSGLGEDVAALKERLVAGVRRNDIKEAVGVCNRSATPLANVFKAGLLRYGSSREDILRAMEEAGRFEVPLLERGLALLATAAHVASLLGLLGTASGLMSSFHALQMRSAAMTPVMPGDVAGGLWVALITTVAGITVAIPSVALHNYFSDRAGRYVFQMEKDAADLAQLLTNVVQMSPQDKE